MIKSIKLYKQSMRGNDHMVVATPENYDPKSQRILVSVNNTVAEATYNPQTKNVTAKLDVPSTNANHPLAALLPQNPDVRVKVFVYDFTKDRILGAKLQEFELNTQTYDYKATDEMVSTAPVILGTFDLKGLAERAKKEEKIEPLLIKKFEGPESVFEEKEYEFRIVEWNKKDISLTDVISKIRWGYKVDDGKLIYITIKPTIDKKSKQIVLKWKVPKTEGSKIAVYTWIEHISEDVKVVCKIKIEFPILIIRSIARKGKKTEIVSGEKVSTNETALDLLYKDYTEDEKGFQKLKKQIYDETFLNEKQDGLLDVVSIEDNAKNKSIEIIDKIIEFSKKSNKQLFEIFVDEAEKLSRGKLEDNIKNMIQKMQNSKGGEYSNTDLTDAVIEHDNTKDFISSVKKWTIFFLKKYKDNLGVLKINDDSEGIIYNSNFKKVVDKPRFNNFPADTFSGIQIAINDVWAYEIFLNKFFIKNNEPHGELQFVFYDHFGLDYPDIQKYDKDIFKVWFLLQHFRGFKPFITKVSFTTKF